MDTHHIDAFVAEYAHSARLAREGRADGVELAQYVESTGLIDDVHGVVGSPWGNPSYIQPTYFDPAELSDLAGQLRAAVSLPVVHTGRINHPDVAERVLVVGHADVVDMARAHIADGDLLAKGARRPHRRHPPLRRRQRVHLAVLRSRTSRSAAP